MPAPYSNDLRWKVVNAYQNDEGNQQEVAQGFSVSLSFVKRLWKNCERKSSTSRQMVILAFVSLLMRRGRGDSG